MYYLLEKNQIVGCSFENWIESQDGFAVLTSEEWKKTPYYSGQQVVLQETESIYLCKIERYRDHMLGTFSVPTKEHWGKHRRFMLYIFPHKVIFIDDSGMVKELVGTISEEKLGNNYTLQRFLYNLLLLLLEGEPVYLEKMENRITKLEEHILKGDYDDFSSQFLELNKEVSRLYRYYGQLSDVGDELLENEDEFFGMDHVVTFEIFAKRAERLQGQALALRDYAMQVQSVYQSEISIRQNNVMKVLTIVTAIFLPLSLIVGWYGMNFANMPELTWKYGYLAVIIVSVIVLGICIWLFKKKNYFK